MRNNGWILTLYGSTLEGNGRDLDVIAINTVPNPSIFYLFDVLRAAGFYPFGGTYHGVFADGYCLKSKEYDFNIDMQIRIAKESGQNKFVME